MSTHCCALPRHGARSRRQAQDIMRTGSCNKAAPLPKCWQMRSAASRPLGTGALTQTCSTQGPSATTCTTADQHNEQCACHRLINKCKRFSCMLAPPLSCPSRQHPTSPVGPSCAPTPQQMPSLTLRFATRPALSNTSSMCEFPLTRPSFKGASMLSTPSCSKLLTDGFSCRREKSDPGAVRKTLLRRLRQPPLRKRSTTRSPIAPRSDA